MYTQDLALHNLEGFIYHKTTPTNIQPIEETAKLELKRREKDVRMDVFLVVNEVLLTNAKLNLIPTDQVTKC